MDILVLLICNRYLFFTSFTFHKKHEEPIHKINTNVSLPPHIWLFAQHYFLKMSKKLVVSLQWCWLVHPRWTPICKTRFYSCNILFTSFTVMIAATRAAVITLGLRLCSMKCSKICSSAWPHLLFHRVSALEVFLNDTNIPEKTGVISTNCKFEKTLKEVRVTVPPQVVYIDHILSVSGLYGFGGVEREAAKITKQ